MKNALFFILILITFSVNAQSKKATTINWMSFNDALKAQKENPKKIMMDVYTNWCGPCKLMEETTFKNEKLVAYINENYYAVKFNAEGPGKIKYNGKTFTNPSYDPTKKNTANSGHQLTDYLQIQGFPTIVFFDIDGSLIAPIPGYSNVKTLELFLKIFYTDTYKTITNQVELKAYKDSFEYEFEK